MSYTEYFDLYLKAQDNPNALYYVVSFDVVNSRLVEDRYKLQINLFKLTKYIYNKLLEKERIENRQIVIKDERFYKPWDYSVYHYNGNYEDPALFGDDIEFTVLRDTVTKEEIVNWFNEYKSVLEMKEEFHIADGYYETNNYEERCYKYYRGYCLQTLEKFHKKETQKEINKVKKKNILNK